MNQWKKTKQTKSLINKIEEIQKEMFSSYLEGEMEGESFAETAQIQVRNIGFVSAMAMVLEEIEILGESIKGEEE